MKVKGLIAIILLVCVTMACGIAASGSKTAVVGSKSYEYGGTIGDMAYYFEGTLLTSKTTTTNLSGGSDTVLAYVSRYNSLDDSLITSKQTKEAVITGNHVEASIIRLTSDSYYYKHQAVRWDISNPNYANDSNRADVFQFVAKQK